LNDDFKSPKNCKFYLLLEKDEKSQHPGGLESDNVFAEKFLTHSLGAGEAASFPETTS